MTQKSRASQSEFEKVIAKAKKNAANDDPNQPAQNYILKDGIPHKYKDGVLVPLKKIN